MDALSLDEVWNRKSALAFSLVADEGVVFDLERRMVRGMNLSAWRVWQQLDGTRSLAEIADDLAAHFALARDAAARDVLAFVSGLRGAALIERVR